MTLNSSGRSAVRGRETAIRAIRGIGPDPSGPTESIGDQLADRIPHLDRHRGVQGTADGSQNGRRAEEILESVGGVDQGDAASSDPETEAGLPRSPGRPAEASAPAAPIS